MKTLECSSRGDKRFSAMYAKVTIGGVEKSIESHYQECKRDSSGGRVRKGQRVDHMVIGGKRLDAKYLTSFYTLLWVKYLRRNPELVTYAKTFAFFNDMFRGKAINCQADVIRDYVRLGDMYLIKEHQEFIRLMDKE
jgi:hypothetical protein